MVQLVGSPVARSILRAIAAILVVQAAYWLVFDPIFHRTKPPGSIVDIAQIEWARPKGIDEKSLRAATWETKELPYSECCEAGYRAVRAGFTLDRAPDRPMGIILRMSSDNFILRMNGSTLFQEGRVDVKDGTYHGNVRRVFLIPEGIAREGRNEFEVVLSHDEGTPYWDFRPPVIGDYETLAKARAHEYFTLNTLATANVAMGALLSFLLLIVVLRGGNRPVMRWFLVVVAAWTAQLLYFEMTDPPLRGIARILYLYTFVTLVPLGWLNLANHWSGRPLRLLGRFTLVLWAAMLGLFAVILYRGLFSRIDTVDIFAMWWGLISALGAVALLLIGVVRNYERRHWETAIFTLCLMLIGIDALSAVFDITVKKYADNAMPFLIIGFVAAYLAENVRLFQSTTSLNTLLQGQLAERTADLEAAHEREKAMVMTQAHQAERQRIMRDMHDGLGSQLMSMLLMAKRGQAEPPVVAEGLQTVIDEMRLMIDSMDSVGESLQSALSIFRERMQARVEGAGKRFEWQEAEMDLPPYGPRAVLQVFRVMQEAVSNALKHSTGDTVTIAIEPADDPAYAVRIIVSDNGAGMGSANARGKGLANMAGRAAAVGARFDLRDSDRGVSVVLDLPASPKVQD